MDVLEQIDDAHLMVVALCTPRGAEGHRDWVMSIPARPDYDPDMVIDRALRRARKEIEQLRQVADAARNLVENISERGLHDNWKGTATALRALDESQG